MNIYTRFSQRHRNSIVAAMIKHTRLQRAASCVLVALTLLVMPNLRAFADDGSPLLLFPSSDGDSAIFGKRIAEWTAEWWQYILSIPFDSNPLFDGTGQFCRVAQHGPVWFLAGTVGGQATRNCTIPQGVALFFPIVNLVSANNDNPTENVGQLRADIAPCFDGATGLSLVVDNRSIPIRPKMRVRSVPFAAESTLLGNPTGQVFLSPAVDDGFYVMLRPLPVGHHTVHFGGSTPCFGTPVDVTYQLDVQRVSLK